MGGAADLRGATFNHTSVRDQANMWFSATRQIASSVFPNHDRELTIEQFSPGSDHFLKHNRHHLGGINMLRL